MRALLAGVADDVTEALRQVRRTPAFSLVIVLTLGGAMAVNTSLFSIFNALFFRQWPVKDADRVLEVEPAVTSAEWRRWREQTRTFEALLASAGGGSVVSDGEPVPIEFVSANYFDVLGLGFQQGRGFDEADDDAGAPGDSALVSHRFWKDRLASDPRAVGKTLRLDGVPFTVAGILAPPFEGVRGRRDVWLPLAALPRLSPPGPRAEPRVTVAGRLRATSSVRQARTEITALSDRFRGDHGLPRAPFAVWPTDRYSRLSSDHLKAVAVHAFLLGPAFLTFVACANVANLLLLRGNARRGEIAVRIALGGSRARLVSQLLLEAGVLSALAGALGVAGAAVLPAWALASVASEITSLSFAPDARVLAWGFGVSALACLAFALAPALQCTRLDVRAALQDAHGHSAPALNSRLPAYQATVSVAVLAIAGLLARGVLQLHSKDFGYSVQDLQLVRLEFPRAYDAARRGELTHRFADALVADAGPLNVAGASEGPLASRSGSVRVFGNYFGLLRIRLLAGRGFPLQDARDDVVVVNESWVRRAGVAEPLGRSVFSRSQERAWRSEIVGVARDAYLSDLESVRPLAFYPVPPTPTSVFFVRARSAAELRALAARIDPAMRADVTSGPAWMARATRVRSVFVRLLAGFGALALALSTLGVFSVSAYSVQRRRREIGVRVALGAARHQVLRAALEPAWRAVLRGLVVGGVAAVCAGFLLRHSIGLNGVSPLDPVTYAAVATLLAITAVAATLLPARRATSVDPARVLRTD